MAQFQFIVTNSFYLLKCGLPQKKLPHLNLNDQSHKTYYENVHIQPNDRIRCVAIIGYILSVHQSKIVLDYLNILLVPEINKLLVYLSPTENNQVIINLSLFILLKQ